MPPLESGRWIADGATVYVLEDCRDARGRPAQQNRIYASFYTGPGTPRAEAEAVAARVADALNSDTVTIPATELARLRAVEGAARALYDNGGGDDGDNFVVRYRYVDELVTALTGSTPDPRDARIAALESIVREAIADPDVAANMDDSLHARARTTLRGDK